MICLVVINIEIKCADCERKDNLELHEIHGNKHPYSVLYFLLHSEDFVFLCCHHHQLRHNETRSKGVKLYNDLKREGKRNRRLALFGEVYLSNIKSYYKHTLYIKIYYCTLLPYLISLLYDTTHGLSPCDEQTC